jgi:hypothetical protein
MREQDLSGFVLESRKARNLPHPAQYGRTPYLSPFYTMPQLDS